MAKPQPYDVVIQGHADGEYVLTVGAADADEARSIAEEHVQQNSAPNGKQLKVGSVKKAS